MTVTCQIDQAKRRIHTRCLGAVSLDEVLQHFTELMRDPECPARLDVLLDLSETTSLPTSPQLTAREPVGWSTSPQSDDAMVHCS